MTSLCNFGSTSDPSHRRFGSSGIQHCKEQAHRCDQSTKSAHQTSLQLTRCLHGTFKSRQMDLVIAMTQIHVKMIQREGNQKQEPETLKMMHAHLISIWGVLKVKHMAWSRLYMAKTYIPSGYKMMWVASLDTPHLHFKHQTLRHWTHQHPSLPSCIIILIYQNTSPLWLTMRFQKLLSVEIFQLRICHPFSEADPSFPTRLWASIEALSSNVSLRNEKSTFYRIRWQKKARFATTMYKKHTRPKTNTTVLRTNNLQKFWACWNFT